MPEDGTCEYVRDGGRPVRQHRLLSGAGWPRGVMLCGSGSHVRLTPVMLRSQYQQLTERHARSATQVHQVGQ